MMPVLLHKQLIKLFNQLFQQTLYQLETFVMQNGREDVIFVKPDVMKGPISRYCSIDVSNVSLKILHSNFYILTCLE